MYPGYWLLPCSLGFLLSTPYQCRGGFRLSFSCLVHVMLLLEVKQRERDSFCNLIATAVPTAQVGVGGLIGRRCSNQPHVCCLGDRERSGASPWHLQKGRWWWLLTISVMVIHDSQLTKTSNQELWPTKHTLSYQCGVAKVCHFFNHNRERGTYLICSYLRFLNTAAIRSVFYLPRSGQHPEDCFSGPLRAENWHEGRTGVGLRQLWQVLHWRCKKSLQATAGRVQWHRWYVMHYLHTPLFCISLGFGDDVLVMNPRTSTCKAFRSINGFLK